MTSEEIYASDFTLQFLVREPNIKPAKNKVIILLHGVGSNEEDLFSLADDLPADAFILSVRAPYTLSAGRYAWFQVDFSTGSPVIDAEQAEKSRTTLVAFIQQVKKHFAADELFLGGFSQGAIMSYSVGLTNPSLVNGIFGLSGRILAEVRSQIQRNETLQQLPVFVAHGVHDQVLPVHYAREAKDYLLQLGVQLSYHEYPFAHNIGNEVLVDLNQWLQQKQ